MKETSVRRLSRLLFRVLTYQAPRIGVPPQGAVLVGVTIVNPGQERRGGQTVTVAGDRIVRLGATQAQEDGRYAGSYVLPGLIDMHVHIPPPTRDLVNLLFLTHGVTTIRETGDADGTTFLGRRRIQDGRVPGPRIFASGPVLDGAPPFLPTSWVVHHPAEAWDAVDTLSALGADFVKVHHKLSAAALTGIREAASAHGLRVVGHVPMAVPFEQAGIWDVQHLDGMVPYARSPDDVFDVQRQWRDLDPARARFYVQVSVEQGLVHTPTIVSGVAFARLANPVQPNAPAARLMPRCYRDVIWSRRYSLPTFRAMSDETLQMMGQAVARSKEVVGELHRAGVRIHLGTDTAGAPFVVPGASLHEELGYVVEAGLTLQEAWAAGTRDAGESLGLPLLGTIQEGAPADLLVFAADPMRDLAALSTLQAVVAQGRLYSRSALDEAISSHRRRFERPLYDGPMTMLVRLAMRQMAG